MKNKISHCERPIVWESAHCCYYCRHYRHALFCSPSRGNDYYSQLNVIPEQEHSITCVSYTSHNPFLYTKINQCSRIVLVIIIVAIVTLKGCFRPGGILNGNVT